MENRTDFFKLTTELEALYPIEGMYGSKCSLYSRALADSVITLEICKEARNHYGHLWNYAGD